MEKCPIGIPMATPNQQPDQHLIEALVAIGRIEGKLDHLNTQQQRLAEMIDRIEARVASLEQSRAWMLGLGAAAGALASMLLELFSKKP